MADISITHFFERLGAPLANSRWSWGAHSAADNVVFLRVWQDKKRIENGERYMLLDGRRALGDDVRNLGYQERLRHIDAIRAGAKPYLVMCIARDVKERPRVILDFHDQDVFVGGELAEFDGGVWIRVAGRVPATDVTLRTGK
jgi:hypothetical protein